MEKVKILETPWKRVEYIEWKSVDPIIKLAIAGICSLHPGIQIFLLPEDAPLDALHQAKRLLVDELYIKREYRRSQYEQVLKLVTLKNLPNPPQACYLVNKIRLFLESSGGERGLRYEFALKFV